MRGHQRGLDDERAGPAHRVREGRALRRQRRPPATQEQRRREVLLERRLDPRLPVTASVQRFAAQVDRDRRAPTAEPQAHAQVRRTQVHGRTLAGARPKPVDDRVLGLLCRELRVPEPRGCLADDVHGQCAARRKVLLPREFPEGLVHGLRGIQGHGADREQHSARRARLEARDVAAPDRAAEADARRMFPRHLESERTQFGREKFRDVPRAGGEEFKFAPRGCIAHEASRSARASSTRSRGGNRSRHFATMR